MNEFVEKIQEGFGEVLANVLEKGYDVNQIFEQHKNLTQQQAAEKVRNIAAGTGAVLGAVPANPVVSGIDLFAILEIMFRGALIQGTVTAVKYGFDAECISYMDCLDILCLWCDDITSMGDERVRRKLLGQSLNKIRSTKIEAKVFLKTQFKAISKAAIKTSTKTVAKYTAVKIGGKFAGKTATKVGVKEAAKISAWVPIIGTAIGATANAGINWWFAGSYREAAEKYFEAKFSISDSEIG